MPLFLDTGCQVLYAGNDSKIGSYKASNTSAIIGGVATAIIFIVAIFTICYYRNRDNKDKKIIPTIVMNPLI
jgi:F0F1-type ATP synthase assembly protein I